MSLLNKWVRLKEPYVVNGNVVVDEYTNGRIKKVDDAGVWVLFGLAYIPVNGLNLRPAPLPTFGEAIAYLKRLKGHHCSEGQYQFDIKVYPTFPDWVYEADKMGIDIWNEYNDICHDELSAFCDRGHSDNSLEADYDWIKSWGTYGRSGGWLVISDRDDSGPQWYQEEIIELQSQLTGLTPEGQESIRQEIENRKAEVISLAMDLQQIERRVKQAKKDFEAYMATDEPWENVREQYEALKGEIEDE